MGYGSFVHHTPADWAANEPLIPSNLTAWDIPLGNPRKHALKRSTERGAIDQGDSPPSLNAAYLFVTMLRLLDCLVTLTCRATSPTASI